MRMTALALLAAAVVLAGCGSDQDEPPEYPIEASDQEQIAATVDSFNRAADELRWRHPLRGGHRAIGSRRNRRGMRRAPGSGDGGGA